MYADQENALVVFDISNPAQARPIDTMQRRMFSSALRGDIANWLNGDALNGNQFGGADGCGTEGCDINNESTDLNVG